MRELSLINPNQLAETLPLSQWALENIAFYRQTVKDILQRQQDRLLVIVGPCSVHDEQAALEYASKLRSTVARFADDLFFVMRVYFEKPRTNLGWKGLISDPHLDGSFDINMGLKRARKLLQEISALEVPIATEFLDTIIPQYLSEFITWGVIGARTTESQLHRELASGLPMPVGFKNTTDGNIKIAIDAVNTARHSHHFLSISKEGQTSIIRTNGNNDCHIILRGSNLAPNYFPNCIEETISTLTNAKLSAQIIVDCSHGNSNKDYLKQTLVVDSIATQIATGTNEIRGVMIESNLIEGKQLFKSKLDLVYGQSITDGCLSWDQTLPLFEKLSSAVKQRRNK